MAVLQILRYTGHQTSSYNYPLREFEIQKFSRNRLRLVVAVSLQDLLDLYPCVGCGSYVARRRADRTLRRAKQDPRKPPRGVARGSGRPRVAWVVALGTIG